MKRKTVLLILAMMALTLFVTACSSGLSGGDDRLHGSWEWNGSVFYRFNQDGTGTMTGSSIRWGVNRNRLEICVTPYICRRRCSAPIGSAFSFSNNDDTLNFNGFTYTRR